MTEDSSAKKIVNVSFPLTFLKVLAVPSLRVTGLRCIASIVGNFFFLQYRAALFPGRIPVTSVDHPLDSRIPFLPQKVNIYLDFVAFWVRPLGFLLKRLGRGALEPVRRFIGTMDALYVFAAEVYGRNLSTTKRPRYLKKPRFFLIHAVDPHLMCIPSLHVMIVIRTYTFFRELIKTLGEETRYAAQAEELRRGALAITDAVLYVKQHSVNCISAAMYAMTRFEPGLFPPDEAERFASEIFVGEETPAAPDSEEIRAYIVSLYRRFLAEGEAGGLWAEPLLNFLKERKQAAE